MPAESSREIPLTQLLRWLAALLVVIAIALRLTVRDLLPGLSILFYCTPLPVLVCTCLTGLILCRWNASRRVTISWGLCLITVTLWWARTDWSISVRQVPPAAEDEFTVLFWNVARYEDLSAAAKFINSVDADIVALVEAGHQTEQRRRFWQETCPQYEPSILGGGIQVLSKGPSGDTRAESLGPGSILREIPVRVRGLSCRVVVADITSEPHIHRELPLAHLAEIVREYGSEPVIIAGDFNTPPDSVHFGLLRQNFREAFEVAGRGYSPTWPVPVPVLKLDQVWVNQPLEIVDCRQFWTAASDHRPVFVRLRPARD